MSDGVRIPVTGGCDECQRIEVFLKRYYSAEIERGEHEGLSLAVIVCQYLARERQHVIAAKRAQ